MSTLLLALKSLFKIDTKTVILIILVVILGLVLAFTIIQVRNLKAEIRDTVNELNAKTIGKQELIDAAGKTFYRIDEYHKTIKELKHSSDSIEQKLYEEMKLNGIRNKQILSMQYALMESIDTLSSSVRDTTFVIDSIVYNKYADFSNGYLTAEVYLASNSNNIELAYNYTAELYMYDSWTKPKFFLWRWLGFKGKTQQFDFKCSDPHANIKVLRAISTKKQK